MRVAAACSRSSLSDVKPVNLRQELSEKLKADVRWNAGFPEEV